MKCQHCNQEIQEDANFCTNCGKPTTSQGALPPVIQQPENQQIQKNAPVIEAEIVEDKKEPSSSVSSSKSFSKQNKEEATPWDSGCLILLLITLFLWWFPPGYILALIGLGVWKAVTRD